MRGKDEQQLDVFTLCGRQAENRNGLWPLR